MIDIDCSTACSAAGLSTQETSDCGSVHILPANVRLTVRTGESIVDAIRRHGYRSRYCCRRGGCGACKTELVDGTVHYAVPIADSVLSAADRRAGKCLPCRAQPVGDIVIRLAERDQLRHIFGSTNLASGNAGS